MVNEGRAQARCKCVSVVDTLRSEQLKLMQKLSARVEITSILEARFLFQCVSTDLSSSWWKGQLISKCLRQILVA